MRASNKDFNRQAYGQSPPISPPVSGVGGFASSNTPTLRRRKRDPTHRDTKNSQNLAFGRDLEGELIAGIDPASTRILGGRSITIIIIAVFINIYIHSHFLL
jgi:hypothetical protein